MSKTSCVMPHIGLALQNNGDFCCCNVNPMSFKDSNNKVMFVHRDRLKDSWSSPTRKYLQESLDSGKRIPECKHCWDLEDSGQISPRNMFNTEFSKIVPDQTQPKVFILKPGNTCNLSCRMCNPETSSSWYRDAHKIAVNKNKFVGTLKEYTKNFEHIRNSFNENNPFWEDFVSWLPKFDLIDIYGGEPFLIDGLFKSLARVNGHGSENVSLQFHTNAQKINSEYLKTLTGYKNTNIRVSIDSHIHSHMEYIRNGCEAETVFSNAVKLIEFSKQWNNIDVGITLTVTTINVYYLDEIMEELKSFGVPIGLNFVTGPDREYDCRHIPIGLKEKIFKKLQANTECNPAIDFLMQELPTSKIFWHKFWKTTDTLDGIRNQSFSKTFPEFYSVAKEYLP